MQPRWLWYPNYSLLCLSVGPWNFIYVGLITILSKYSILCSQLDLAICLDVASIALISKLFTNVLHSWTILVQCWIEDASQISSIGPFSYNAELEMRPKFNTVSSQLDLSRTILDWRCVPKFFLNWTFLVQCWIGDAPKVWYCVFSAGPLLYNTGLKMRPKIFLNWTFFVQCWIEDAPKV